MTISATTIGLLIDAGLTGETLKAITAAIEADVTNACNMLREHVRNDVTLSDAGSVTPAALRMQKMRQKRALLAESCSGTERNTVTEQTVTESVTSDNNLPLESKGIEEGKKVRNARARKSYPELFEKFWLVFPTDPGMSKAEAFKAWGRLPCEDHQSTIDAIPAFKDWVRKQGETYRIVHACRYLSQRRFDGFKAQVEQAKEAPINGRTYVKYGTDAGDAWVADYKAKGKIAPRDNLGGWWFPSEYPSEGATQ